MNVLYTAEATAWGGRDGRVSSDDGIFDVAVKPPKELGGPGGATNPEQLFAAGWAACFHSALKLVARRQKIDADESAVTARIGLVMTEAGGFTVNAQLEVEVSGLDHDATLALAREAHKVCPYSNATRGNVEVELTAV